MKSKSIWGNPPSRLYRFRELLVKHFGAKAKICIIGASDGKFVLPFLRAGFIVTAYEIDNTAVYGGEKIFPIERNYIQKQKYIPNPSRNPIYQTVPSETRTIMGLKKRAEIEGLDHLLKIKMVDFYRNPPIESFEGVFTSCSISYPCNFDIPVADIIASLKKVVKKDGYLYMDYMLPLEDCHSWRPEHYLRRGMIKSFFTANNWKIIHLQEMTKPLFEKAHVDRPEDHFHRFGYVLAKHT